MNTWPVAALRDVADIQLGKMLSPAAKRGARPLPYLRNANVQWDGFDLADVAQMDFTEAEEAKFLLRKGDVLVVEGGEPGRAAVWDGSIERVCYQKAVHRIRPHDDRLDPQFLVYRLWAGGLRGEFTSGETKTTIAHLPLVRLKRVAVPLPPLDEQRRIAARLRDQVAEVGRVESSIASRTDAVRATADTLVEAAFSVQSPDATVRAVGAVATIQTGYAFKSSWFRPNGVRLLRNANVLPDEVDWSDTVRLDPALEGSFSAYALAPGDIVLALDRPVIASGLKITRLGERDTPSLLLQRVARVQPGPAVDADYLYGFMHTRQFKSAMSGHSQSLGVPHVSPRQVANVPIPLPSLADQRRIAARLSEQLAEIDRAKAALAAQRAEIGLLPPALLREVFGAEEDS